MPDSVVIAGADVAGLDDGGEGSENEGKGKESLSDGGKHNCAAVVCEIT